MSRRHRKQPTPIAAFVLEMEFSPAVPPLSLPGAVQAVWIAFAIIAVLLLASCGRPAPPPQRYLTSCSQVIGKGSSLRGKVTCLEQKIAITKGVAKYNYPAPTKLPVFVAAAPLGDTTEHVSETVNTPTYALFAVTDSSGKIVPTASGVLSLVVIVEAKPSSLSRPWRRLYQLQASRAKA